MIDPTGVIWTVTGTRANARAGDGGHASAASLGSPRGIAIDAYGNLVIAEADSSSVRMIAFGGTPQCPEGYACTCGLVPVPCSSPTQLCPGPGNIYPKNASEGFVSRGLPSPISPSGACYTSQSPCPLGSYCSGGVAVACPIGTFGVAVQQSVVSSCPRCPFGTYGTAEGATSNSTCKFCPLGTIATAAGAAFCTFCPPGTYASSGSSNASLASLCVPCPSGAYSLFGSTSCVALVPAASLAVAGTTSTLFDSSRNLVVIQSHSATGSSSTAASLELIVALVIALFFASPYFVLLLMRATCVPGPKHRRCHCRRGGRAIEPPCRSARAEELDRRLTWLLRQVDATASKDVSWVAVRDGGWGVRDAPGLCSAHSTLPVRAYGFAAHLCCRAPGPSHDCVRRRHHPCRAGARLGARRNPHHSGQCDCNNNWGVRQRRYVQCLQFATANSIRVRSLLPLLSTDEADVGAWPPSKLAAPSPLLGMRAGVVVHISAMGPSCAAPVQGSVVSKVGGWASWFARQEGLP